jgi:hypothetical protein
MVSGSAICALTVGTNDPVGGTGMKIVGIEGMTPSEITMEVQKGAKFVIYQYCISIVIMTFKRGTDIYFVRADESAVGKGMPYTLVSAIAGWWGIPWGPIYTVVALTNNMKGGKDVTQQVVAFLNQQQANGQRVA